MNDKQMPLMLSLLDETQNKKKMNTRESKERNFEKKSKRNRVSCFNIYIVVFAFLSSTIQGSTESGKSGKVREFENW